VKAGQPPGPNTVTGKGETIPYYLVADYLPDDFDPSTVTEAMIEAKIHGLNRELIAARVRRFSCGISPVGGAKTLRGQPDGTVLVTDGPYPETKEQLGGIQVLNARDLNHAIQLISQSPGVKLECGTIEIRPAANINEMMSENERRRREETARVEPTPQENA
jgi:hypothetical protein